MVYVENIQEIQNLPLDVNGKQDMLGGTEARLLNVGS
jgi:hypothetical protein